MLHFDLAVIRALQYNTCHGWGWTAHRPTHFLEFSGMEAGAEGGDAKALEGGETAEGVDREDLFV